MFGTDGSLLHQLQRAMQALGLFVIVALTLAALTATIASALGFLPWPDLSLRWGGQIVPDAGMYAQIALTGLLVMLCFFLPANARMSRLERSHRSFNISMEDVRHAYEVAHANDRRSVFTLSSEFEAMRKRMEYMREHPDLAHLEPELLQLAAQMSHESRDLARVYSEDRVRRAKVFLMQRQEDVESLTERLKLARATCDEMRRWLNDIEAGERTNNQSLRRLEADLREILPLLGYDVDDMRDANVVSLPKQSGQQIPAPQK